VDDQDEFARYQRPLRVLPPLEDGEPVYVCVECGATYTARSGLERHWEDERHSPEHIQRERLRQSRKNEGWLLPEEDGR
jgi:hypothetical protein